MKDTDMTNDDDNFFNIITKSLVTLCLSSFANSDLSLPFTGKQDKKKGRWCGVARWQYRINKLLKYTSFAEHFLWIWETKLLKEGRLLLRRFCQVKCGFFFGMTVMSFLCRGVWFHQNFNKRLYAIKRNKNHIPSNCLPRLAHAIWTSKFRYGLQLCTNVRMNVSDGFNCNMI